MEGTKVTVFGFTDADGLSVARIVAENGELVLRSDAGVPQWAGRGRGAGKGGGQGNRDDGTGRSSEISGTDLRLS